MGFFDEIGSKLTGIGQGAVDKTQSFTEIVKMNSEISELEREINTSYTEIGKLYYQKYAAEAEDPEILAYLQKIVGNMKEIEGLQAQIHNIKGMVKCKNCGAAINAKAIFCNCCGAKQVPDVPICGNGDICPECGNVIAEGQVFCTNCGRRLIEVQQEAAEEKVEELEGMSCPNCGSLLEKRMSFCPNCGMQMPK